MRPWTSSTGTSIWRSAREMGSHGLLETLWTFYRRVGFCYLTISYLHAQVQVVPCCACAFLPRTAVMSIMQCHQDRFVAIIAIVCSSWVAMCRAGSGRTFLNPCGFPGVGFVERGNLMASRHIACKRHARAILNLHADCPAGWRCCST